MAMLHVIAALLASAPALPGAFAQTAAELPRIEDFRADLSAAEIEAARAMRTRNLAAQAYIWGIPAFLHFRQATEFKRARLFMAPNEEPFGGWILMRDLATPAVNNALPNVDTLYGASYVRLDKQGPVILSTPAVRGRYFSVAILDAYFNNFAIVGTGNTGADAANFLIAPPGWTGAAPAGIDKVFIAPTPSIALFQRIYTRGPEDVAEVRRIQDQIRLAPLASWQSPNAAFPHSDTPELDAAAVRETRDPLAYFGYVNACTKLNPPSIEYAALLAALAEVGLGPGAALPNQPQLIQAILDGTKEGRTILDAAISEGPYRNGWRVPDPRGGKPGPYALAQAVLQITQIGSLPMDEAVYYVSRRDAGGEVLLGRQGYTLTFPPGLLPPVDPKGFWSVTMYKASDNLLVANEINRYVIRPTTPGLQHNADGSLTIYMAERKTQLAPEGNWLPAPSGGFLVALRAYLPKEAIMDGTWFPPAIQKAP